MSVGVSKAESQGGQIIELTGKNRSLYMQPRGLAINFGVHETDVVVFKYTLQ